MRKNRLLGIILSAICVGTIFFNSGTVAEAAYDQYTYVSPAYVGMANGMMMDGYSICEGVTFSNDQELLGQMRNDMKKHLSMYQYVYYITEDLYDVLYNKYMTGYDNPGFYMDILDMNTDQMGGASDEGDYLREEGRWMSSGLGLELGKGLTAVRFVENPTFNVLDMVYEEVIEDKYVAVFSAVDRYSTTGEQELQLTNDVRALCTTGELGQYRYASNYDKITAATRWVNNHVAYSFLGNTDGYYLTACSAYYQGLADCRGYALLLYRILREFDIPNRIIYRSSDASHLWNIVYLDGRYYSCDASSGEILGGISDNVLHEIATYGSVEYSDFLWNNVSRVPYTPDANTQYNGLYGLAPASDGNWYLYENGQIATYYNDLYCDSNVGWWKVTGGQVDFGYTGLYYSPTCGWWLIGGGSVAFDYTDLWGDPIYGWWKVTGGTVDFDYTGLYESPTCGWWLIGGGSVAFDYTDLWGDPVYGWWKVTGGTVDFWYTGLYDSPQYGGWNVNGGAVVF